MTPGNLSYRTGITLHDPFSGTDGNVMRQLTRPVTASKPSGTAGLAATQAGRSQGMNNVANASHAMAGIRADQNMDQQAKRSQASISGLTQGAEQNQDMVQRGIAERGLATDVFNNNLGFATGLATTQIRAMQSLMQQMRNHMRSASDELG
jgi:hypothetical protein